MKALFQLAAPLYQISRWGAKNGTEVASVWRSAAKRTELLRLRKDEETCARRRFYRQEKRLNKALRTNKVFLQSVR